MNRSALLKIDAAIDGDGLESLEHYWSPGRSCCRAGATSYRTGELALAKCG